MPRESKTAKRARALEVESRLEALYPPEECFLHHGSVFQLTIAVLLSAQTTDDAVNKVTPEFFSRWPDAAALAAAPLEEIEEVVHPLGFFRSKARHARDCARMVVAEYGGEVPCDIELLQTLPGVGRKTANIVMNEGFGIVEGIAVDTHVNRIAHRLDFSRATTAEACERDLLALYPRECWGPVNHTWIRHGRQTCDARSPRCGECVLVDLCPRRGV